jgi:hypothetical protein
VKIIDASFKFSMPQKSGFFLMFVVNMITDRKMMEKVDLSDRQTSAPFLVV